MCLRDCIQQPEVDEIAINGRIPGYDQEIQVEGTKVRWVFSDDGDKLCLGRWVSATPDVENPEQRHRNRKAIEERLDLLLAENHVHISDTLDMCTDDVLDTSHKAHRDSIGFSFCDFPCCENLDRMVLRAFQEHTCGREVGQVHERP